MRILIGALSVAMLAGCVSPAMYDARSKSPTLVLASAKPTPLVAECIKFSWQDEGVFGVDASAYINTGKSGELTVYTRDAGSFGAAGHGHGGQLLRQTARRQCSHAPYGDAGDVSVTRLQRWT